MSEASGADPAQRVPRWPRVGCMAKVLSKAAFWSLARNPGVITRMKVLVFVMGFSEFDSLRSHQSWSK